jgi:hypothetical protein
MNTASELQVELFHEKKAEMKRPVALSSWMQYGGN